MIEDEDWPFPDPLPDENISLAARLASLEGRMNMLATNLAGHARKEQDQYATLHAEVIALSKQVGAIVDALRNVAGTDWAELSEEVGKSKRLTARIVRWLARQAKPIGIILGAIAAAVGLFHYGQSKGEEAPVPTPAEQHEPAVERGDG